MPVAMGRLASGRGYPALLTSSYDRSPRSVRLVGYRLDGRTCQPLSASTGNAALTVSGGCDCSAPKDGDRNAPAGALLMALALVVGVRRRRRAG
jgi:MYXO-CTERM domain-containing protein